MVLYRRNYDTGVGRLDKIVIMGHLVDIINKGKYLPGNDKDHDDLGYIPTAVKSRSSNHHIGKNWQKALETDLKEEAGSVENV